MIVGTSVWIEFLAGRDTWQVALLVGTATSTCSPSVGPAQHLGLPAGAGPVVIVRRTCLPPFGTSTVAVPLVRLTARPAATAIGQLAHGDAERAFGRALFSR